MTGKYDYLKKHMEHCYEDKNTNISYNNMFFSLKEIEILKAEQEIGFSFPQELREFYLEIGFGYLTVGNGFNNQYLNSNGILPPDIVSRFYRGKSSIKLLDKDGYYMKRDTYELLGKKNLAFFDIDGEFYMTLKPFSENPNAVWCNYGNEKIEDSFERFIWRLYYEGPSYYSVEWDKAYEEERVKKEEEKRIQEEIEARKPWEQKLSEKLEEYKKINKDVLRSEIQKMMNNKDNFLLLKKHADYFNRDTLLEAIDLIKKRTSFNDKECEELLELLKNQ